MGKLKISNRAWVITASCLAAAWGMLVGYLIVHIVDRPEFLCISVVIAIMWLLAVVNVRD